MVDMIDGNHNEQSINEFDGILVEEYRNRFPLRIECSYDH